jgi:hypothetical protein
VRDPRKLIPPLHGALLKNEQDVHLFERQGGWAPIVAPSALAFDDNYITPRALAASELPDLIASFALAAQRALAAGFEADRNPWRARLSAARVHVAAEQSAKRRLTVAASTIAFA